MKKLLFITAIGLSCLSAGAATLPQAETALLEKNATLTVQDQKELIEIREKVPVSWKVTCPNGITYTGTLYTAPENAVALAEAIASAPCPD